jgi:hypothetical protein
MLPRDTLPLSQVARTAALLPVGDPRQQAFQRSLAGQLGQTMQAEVLARLDDGSFVVRVGELAARMPLPQGAQPGQQLPLTLVALTPRPTFQVETGSGPAFAEAAPAPGEGAHAQPAGPSPALAYLEGKDASAQSAALARSSALLAQTRTPAPLSGGDSKGGANMSISPAGKLLGEVIAAAQKAAASDGTAAGAAVGRTPLLAAPSLEPGQIAAALQQGLDKSGLFYESHVAEWAQGARTLGELGAEPQARGMPDPLDPNTAQLINQQLTAQEQGRVAWQGQLWPGQDLHWEIERDAPEGKREDGDGDGEARPGWQSRLRLRFAGLGEVSAQVVLSGDQLHIRLDALEPHAGARLDAERARLAAALEAAGTPLATLAIHGVRPADPGPLPLQAGEDAAGA